MCKTISKGKEATYEEVFETARQIEEELGLDNSTSKTSHSDKISKYFAKKWKINNNNLVVRVQMMDPTPDLSGIESLNLEDIEPTEEETLEVRQTMAQQCFEDHHKCCHECGSPDHLRKDCPKYKAHMKSLNKKRESHKGAWIPRQKERPKENADQ